MSGKRTGRDDDRYRTDGGRGGDLTDLEGIGSARAAKLRDAGFESVEDLRGADRDDLVDVLGPELTDRVLDQVADAGGSTDASTADGPDTDESADAGPTVPSASDDADADESGTGHADAGESGAGDADESGPSVPSSSEGTSDAEGEPGGGVGRASGREEQGGTAGNAGTPTTGSDDDAILAGLVSFLVPGVGNMISGQTDRGVIILVIWIIWLIVGWGIGVFIVGSIIGVLTLGIGFILIALVVGLLEFLIHVLAAVDAYRGSKVVDNVTGKVNQVRGN